MPKDVNQDSCYQLERGEQKKEIVMFLHPSFLTTLKNMYMASAHKNFTIVLIPCTKLLL